MNDDEFTALLLAEGRGNSASPKPAQSVGVQVSSMPIHKPLSRQKDDQGDLANSRVDLATANDREVNERTNQWLEANRGLVMRIFPGKTQRLILEKERLMVGTMLEFRLNLLRLSTQFKMEATRDRYDAALKGLKAQNRVEMIKFLISKFNELNQAVREGQLVGMQQINAMYHDAMVNERPDSRANLLQRARQREDRYLDVMDKLVDSFESILDEHL